MKRFCSLSALFPVFLSTAIFAAKPAKDHCHSAVDPYIPATEKSNFFKAAGKDSELSEEEFEANRKLKSGAFVRKFDSFQEMKLHDRDKNKTLDWMEAETYRQNIRRRMLHAFDKDKNGKLQGDERKAANLALEKGKIPGGPKKKGLVKRVLTGKHYDDDAGMLVRFDTSGDGLLSEEEMKAAYKKLAEEERARIIKEFDTDGDGKLSDEEKQAMREERGGVWKANAEKWVLQHFDADGDGEIGEAEKAELEAFGKKVGEIGKSMFMRVADLDGDGEVSEEEKTKLKQEFMVTGLRLAMKANKWVDLNGDGDISSRERKKFNKKMAQASHSWFTAFANQYDADKNDKLDKGERDNLVKGMQEEVDRRYKEGDTDGDGRIGGSEAEAMLESFGREIGLLPPEKKGKKKK